MCIDPAESCNQNSCENLDLRTFSGRASWDYPDVKVHSIPRYLGSGPVKIKHTHTQIHIQVSIFVFHWSQIFFPQQFLSLITEWMVAVVESNFSIISDEKKLKHKFISPPITKEITWRTRNESHINSIIITGVTDFGQILIHRGGLHVHCNKKKLHVFLFNCKLCIAGDGSDHYINDHNLVNPE